MEIREKILFLLKTNKVSQKRMAEIQGMTPGNLSQILQGKQSISLNFILNLKKEFPKIDFNNLLSEETDFSEITSVAEEQSKYGEKDLSYKSAIMEIKKILEKTQN